MLRRFWIEFECEEPLALPGGVALGCGVTAESFEKALSMVDERVFHQVARPPIRRVIEDVDVSTLDQHHVVPNMGVVVRRGIWFPLGYSEY